MTTEPSPTPLPDMPTSRPVAFPLGWVLTAVWTGIYLHCMAQSGWVWDRGLGVLGFGMPSQGVLMAHGQASPPLVEGGAWHRLLLDGLIPMTLLDLVFNVWVGFKLARTLQGFAGTSRACVALLLGGVGGSLLYVFTHPLSDYGGHGGLGMWMGGIGAALMTGLLGRSAMHAQLRRFALRWTLGLCLMALLFNLLMGSSATATARAMWPGLAGGAVGGIATVLLLGPRTHLRPAGPVAIGVALLLLGGVAYGAIVQAPRAVATQVWAERGETLSNALKDLETAAERCMRRGWKARHRKAVADKLATIRALPWLDELDGREALRTWLAEFDPFATGTLIDPDRALRVTMPAAWKAWLPFENRLRQEAGLPTRDPDLPVRGQ